MPPAEITFNYNIIKIFVGYTSILVILFSRFFYTNYVSCDIKSKI